MQRVHPRLPIPTAHGCSPRRSSACAGALLRLTSPSMWGVGSPNGCDLQRSAGVSGAHDITLTLFVRGQPMREDRPLHQACAPALRSTAARVSQKTAVRMDRERCVNGTAQVARENWALLLPRTGAVEAGHDGGHAAGANGCGLRTMPAVARTMRIVHAAPLTTLCSAPPAATGHGWPSPLPPRSCRRASL